MVWQYVIIAAVLIIAVGYAAWRVFQALRHAGDPCYGCQGCQLQQLRRQARKRGKCSERRRL